MDYLKEAEELLMHTYGRYNILLDKGEGVYLYDIEGKKYLDFGAGIAVFALGYGNKEYNNALKNQIDKLIHTSNYYYNLPAIEASKRFLKATGMDRVFFTNSGTEAIEGAIKLARKYYFKKHGKGDSEIISMEQSFHGRSLGALSVTGNKSYREPFEPLLSGAVFANLNDYESVVSKVNEKTCAIILEVIQGEGGIYEAKPEFLSKIRSLCDDKDILLILDEIQCGMGRTGTMFAYEGCNIKPDIVTSAKALGCGVPVGAFAATKKVANTFGIGDHGSTYGGNPLVCSAINAVFDLFEKEKILDNVYEVGKYLEMKLNELVAKYDFIIERRGKGLIQGIEFGIPIKPIISKCMDNGLILYGAGNNTMRFLPPLIISKENVDDMICILENSLS